MTNDKLVTVGQHVDLAELVDKRLDDLEANSPKGQSLTLAQSSWTNDSGDTNYPYQYNLTVAGLTAESRADVVLDAASVAVASDCGVCAVCETAADTVIFKSRTAPTADLTGLIYITQTAAMSSAE